MQPGVEIELWYIIIWELGSPQKINNYLIQNVKMVIKSTFMSFQALLFQDKSWTPSPIFITKNQHHHSSLSFAHFYNSLYSIDNVFTGDNTFLDDSIDVQIIKVNGYYP